MCACLDLYNAISPIIVRGSLLNSYHEGVQQDGPDAVLEASIWHHGTIE